MRELDDWHPLDGVPAPEYVPGVWTPEHLAYRVLGAFLVLRMAPESDLVRGFKTAWPVYEYSKEDRDAQAEQAAAEDRKRRGPGRPSARFKPTGQELSQMDAVLGWLLSLGMRDPEAVRAICGWAYERARGSDKDQDAFGRVEIERGLAWLADRLNFAGTPVF